MFDKSAIEQVQKASAESVEAYHQTIENACNSENMPFVALPESMRVQELNTEKYLTFRRRFRGTFTTTSIEDFVAYCLNNSDDNTVCFISDYTMNAKCILDIGNVAEPGHCVHKAELALEMTPEFRALLSICDSKQLQGPLAEWMEDWRDGLNCFDGDNNSIGTAQAIIGVRKITIESAKKQESEVQSFSAERSALESINANADGNRPHLLTFTCKPYEELSERTFEMRVAMHIEDNKAPRIKLHIKQLAKHNQEMCDELASKLLGEFNDTIIVYTARFSE